MDWDRYRQFLLQNIPGAKPKKGGQEINCRCRECPDSSDPRSAHMYISIPINNDEPSLYNCFKCGCKGIVTHKTLISWGLFDTDIADQLVKYNTSISNNPRNNKYFGHYTYQIRNTYTTIDAKSEEKRQYLTNRLGVDLSFSELQKLKISLNMLDLLKENNVRELSRDINIVKDLDREFIGFISIDNAYMNMRRTCEEGQVSKEVDKRYINYKIFDKFGTEERFYTVPTKVDLNRNERVKLHIAEGPFDILSVYLNLRHREEGIYTSITGNNPINVITHFLENYKLPYMEIHYYADNDKYGKEGRIRYLLNLLPDQFPAFLHRNMMPEQKDFGVPLSKINESIKMI